MMVKSINNNFTARKRTSNVSPVIKVIDIPIRNREGNIVAIMYPDQSVAFYPYVMSVSLAIELVEFMKWLKDNFEKV